MRWRRQLSSDELFVVKVGPVAFAALWWSGAIMTFFDLRTCGEACGLVDLVATVVIACVVSALAWLVTRRLKRVRIENGMLVISDYLLHSIEVDPRHIRSVTMHRHFFDYARIELAESTRFGARVAFIPESTGPRFARWGEDPTPDEVTTLVRLAAEAKKERADGIDGTVSIEEAERELRLRGL